MGIRVNAVRPGIIRTPMLLAASSYQCAPRWTRARAQRIGEPRGGRLLVLFLASDDWASSLAS
jgi:NAD(P)-dependent dehydrogenase (short-subunit alcohol dehydrogenase family)